MSYTKIKSEFVKKELRKTKWKNSEYIDHLMDIELFATTGYCSTGAGYIQRMLKDKYPKQWKAIWQELDPQSYRESVKREKIKAEREREEEKVRKEKDRLAYQRYRREWKEMGGKW